MKMDDLKAWIEDISIRCPGCKGTQISSSNDRNHHCLNCDHKFSEGEALPSRASERILAERTSMLAKPVFVNNLLDRWICPISNYGNPAALPLEISPNSTIWAGIQPDSMGHYRAQIHAVWIEDGTIKVSATDSHGNTSDFWFKLVRLEI